MRSYHRRFLLFIILGIVCIILGVLMKVFHYGYGYITGEGVIVVGLLLALNAILFHKKEKDSE